MNIQLNKVTRLSQLVAIVLFVGVFLLGFYLGKVHERHAYQNAFRAVMEGEL